MSIFVGAIVFLAGFIAGVFVVALISAGGDDR